METHCLLFACTPFLTLIKRKDCRSSSSVVVAFVLFFHFDELSSQLLFVVLAFFFTQLLAVIPVVVTYVEFKTRTPLLTFQIEHDNIL
jgi:hypothetical protein